MNVKGESVVHAIFFTRKQLSKHLYEMCVYQTGCGDADTARDVPHKAFKRERGHTRLLTLGSALWAARPMEKGKWTAMKVPDRIEARGEQGNELEL